jgi:hypothetical protein
MADDPDAFDQVTGGWPLGALVCKVYKEERTSATTAATRCSRAGIDWAAKSAASGDSSGGSPPRGWSSGATRPGKTTGARDPELPAGSVLWMFDQSDMVAARRAWGGQNLKAMIDRGRNWRD